jgi:site-specific DNA-methyltransferase (adenine-specific)
LATSPTAKRARLAQTAPPSCSPECVTLAIDELGSRSQPLSRLFYAAKADPHEREAGCAQLPQSDRSFFDGPVRPRSNIHPTVKPIDLMRWLVRLTAPPGGVVLDPFAGSGSTGCAAVLEGRQFIGIEREPAFVSIARARLAYWANVAPTDRR